jgi:dihydroflavonol-4-reductase
VRVLVTGATGFTGAHTTKALVDAGHDVVALVRDRVRIDENVKPLGVDGIQSVVGDMTDEESVGEALDGCDAVVHTAALVVTGRNRAAEVLNTNSTGARVVLGLAAERGLRSIVHVSSIGALYDASARVIDRTTGLASPSGAYARSKVEADRVARRLQSDGAPVTIVYPGAILGPRAGALSGESASTLAYFAKTGVVLLRDGGWSAVDVRDLAAVHVACIESPVGPSRFVCGGPYVAWREVASLLRRVTGRRFPVAPLPGAVLRGLGWSVDALGRWRTMTTPISLESMRLATQWVPTDDSAVADELGIEWRDPGETIEATLRSLYELGELSAKQVGHVACRGSSRRSASS